MSFASFVDDIAESLNRGIRAVVDSEIIPKAVGKATRIGLNVGKPIANAGFKVGMGTINTGLGGANFIKDNYKAIGKGLKNAGLGVFDEGREWAHAAGTVADKFDRTFLKKTTLDKSLIGRSFNKKGLALVAVGATAVQGGKATAQYVQDRQGSNDGQLYRPTTQMSTPYQLSQQMATSPQGRSFADNAGATGDLVFALNNMRHG